MSPRRKSAAVLTYENLLLLSANAITGSAGADWISGTDADDAISALGGDDNIHAPVGNNVIDGGDGIDTLVIYEGVKSQFDAELLDSGNVQLTGPGLNEPQITYELLNVERVAFNDGTVEVDSLVPTPTDPTPTDPTPTDPTPTDPTPTDPTPTDPTPTDPTPTDPTPTDPTPTDPTPTDPTPTDPTPTDPTPTDPTPTDPTPTDPTPTDPTPTDPTPTDPTPTDPTPTDPTPTDPTPTDPTSTVPNVIGTSQADWLSGTDSDDVIHALEGDDNIHAPVGNNTVDGGAGFDTLVIYDGIRQSYTAETESDGSVKLTGPGLNVPALTYTLINVEQVFFNDGPVSISDLTGEPTDPTPTDPPPTDPPPTDPTPTDPPPTDPTPTDPTPTDPTPTDPTVPNVVGTTENDWISGTDSDDVIHALEGDDNIHAPVGNNVVDGGDGLDTLVIYEGIRSAYSAELLSDGSVQLTGPGLNTPSINYTLTNVEQISFNDGTVNISTLLSGPTDPGPDPVDPEPTDPEPTDPEPTDPGPTDPDPDVPDPGSDATIVGTNADDWLSGTDVDDVIDARRGNDSIHAPVGDNTIDGGSGIDTLVIYEGIQSQYDLTTLPDGRLQLTGPGIGGVEITYTLANVERIHFNDGAIEVGSDPDAGGTSGGTDEPGDTGEPQPPTSSYSPPVPEPTPQVSSGPGIEAFHRSGQTFLTWDELTSVDGEEYHVYRHTEEITAANLSDATQLTQKWGPLDDDTSTHQLAGAGAPTNFVITDLGEALDDDTGLFVYTTQDDQQGDAWYAVTVVIDGVEQPLTADGRLLAAPVQESVAEAAPILVNSVNEGHGLVFTQFMDYTQWNPTYQGYAYNYAVALPGDYDPDRDYALKTELHAHSEQHKFIPETEYDWDAIQLFVDDPGASRGTGHTWWFGFAADHNYKTDGDIPAEGTVENFTQQRIIRAIDEVKQRFSVDDQRIHAQGNSMGASGALSLGIHYADVFAGIYASQPMTNYATSPAFQSEFVRLWGDVSDNLTIVNAGSHGEVIEQYSAGQANETGVYDWLDHGKQLIRRRGEPISFLMFGHGKQDNVIDWATQGRPFVEALEQANVGYTASQSGNAGHTWLGYDGVPHNLFSAAYPDLGDWAFLNNVSFPAISNASTTVLPSPDSGDTRYNLSFDWATAWNAFDDPIVDSADAYEVTVRSLDQPATADVTPRNLQQFAATPGDIVTWENVDRNTDAVISSGTAVVDADGLLTISGFEIRDGAGSRLRIERV